MTQTRTNAFYDGGNHQSKNSKALGQTLSISSSTNNGGAAGNGPPQPKKPHHLAAPVHQKQFMQTMQNITEEAIHFHHGGNGQQNQQVFVQNGAIPNQQAMVGAHLQNSHNNLGNQ